MPAATIFLAPNELMGEFYFSKDPVALAIKNLSNYDDAGMYVCPGCVEGEEACEEMFDMTNNPFRQVERENRYGRGRSVSVGDVVNFNGVNYLCDKFGWKAL